MISKLRSPSKMTCRALSVTAKSGQQLKLAEFWQRRRQYRRRERGSARHYRHQYAWRVSENTADMTMALILAVPRRLVEVATS